MSDWIGLGIFVFVVVGAVVGLSFLGKRPKPLTAEEYEKRVAEAKGTARGVAVAGLGALDKFVNPKAVIAVEVQQDLKAGYYDDQEEEGEGDKPGAVVRGLGPTDEGGADA
ncbi:MAG: hypothetical protein QOH49_1308 [Acidobacteriota bacterium]|jgi:hypothetical protein|nr:hypothetical protein [Acidobacteriota bacterium]